MKAGDLIDLLMSYQNDDEIEIEIYETTSGHYIDTTASISIVENDAFVPTLKIDVEAGKFKDFPSFSMALLRFFGPNKYPYPQLAHFT